MQVTILHIDEVLPYVKNNKEFIHVVKDGYQVIDYTFVSGDIFKYPFETGITQEEKHKRLIQLQCRGLKFDLSGNIIGRPFHKFKNYGEDGHIKNMYDWSAPHRIMTKLDGSMVHTCIINGELRLCTRMGITDQSIAAEKLLTPEMIKILRDVHYCGQNVIFEYTAPDNRIVIEYNEPKLTVLAVRDIVSGVYHEPNLGNELFNYVDTHSLTLADSMIEQLRAETTGIEGYVVAWDDGTYVKIKSDEYTQMHRAVSYFDRENMILPVVLDSQCDDLYPNLSPDRAARLFEYESAVMSEFLDYVRFVSSTASEAKAQNQSRKDYALWVNSHAPAGLRAAFFSALDGKDVKDAVKACILRNPDLLSVRW